MEFVFANDKANAGLFAGLRELQKKQAGVYAKLGETPDDEKLKIAAETATAEVSEYLAKNKIRPASPDEIQVHLAQFRDADVRRREAPRFLAPNNVWVLQEKKVKGENPAKDSDGEEKPKKAKKAKK